MPPVADQPNAFGGSFNPNLMPAIVACKFADANPTLGATPASPGEFPADACLDPIPGIVDVDEEHYKSAWDTDKDAGGTFRVFVTFGNSATPAVLGFVDIALVSGGGAKKAKTNQAVETEVANAGRTIPVKYRIETEANEQLADAFETVLIPGPGNTEVCDPANGLNEECIIVTVPTTGGDYVVPSANPFGGAIAGISLPNGWSVTPRNLLITCNNGSFSTGANTSSDFANLVFLPGEGPLGSAADQSVIAEWPLFCEFVFDPPFTANDPPINPPAVIGLCDVDDQVAGQDPLHHTNFDLSSPLIQIGRNTGGLDGLGNIPNGPNTPDFDRTGTSDDLTFQKTAAPSFLDCDGAAVPIASVIGNPAYPSIFGSLAGLLGRVMMPEALHASGMVVRDGGIGATLGSVRTIYGLVELTPVVVDYEDPVGFLNIGTGTPPANWADASFDPTMSNGGTSAPGLFVTAQGQGTTCSIYNPPSGSTTDPLVIGTTFGLNETIILQKRFDLPDDATGLRLHIAIDNDFRFAVNGTEYTLDAANAPFVEQLHGDPAVGLHVSRTSAPAFPAGYNRAGTHGLSIVGSWLQHENCAVQDDIVIDLTNVMAPGQENVITVLARDRGTVGVAGMKIEVEYGGHGN